MVLTKIQEKALLDKRISIAVGSWKISKFDVKGKGYYGFHNHKGHFVTRLQRTGQIKRRFQLQAKRTILEARIPGYRGVQVFFINFYTQHQATVLSNRIRKGRVPLNSNKRGSRNVDLLFDKIVWVRASNIKFTS